LGFALYSKLAQIIPAFVCSSCPSDRDFAYSFLQIPPHDGHPCCSANGSPLSGTIVVFHYLAITHAGHTIKARYLLDNEPLKIILFFSLFVFIYIISY
jgi:hypothetical protein